MKTSIQFYKKKNVKFQKEPYKALKGLLKHTPQPEVVGEKATLTFIEIFSVFSVGIESSYFRQATPIFLCFLRKSDFI